VDGGANNDTLKVLSTVTNIDLTLVRDDAYTNFEVIDADNGTVQFIKISDVDVLALAGEGGVLLKLDSTDGVRLVGAGWDSLAGLEDIDGVNYISWESGDALIKIPETVAVGFLFVGDETSASVTGAAGSDEYYGYGGDDTFIAGEGDDYADGGDEDDSLLGGDGNDTLIGGGGNDSLYGEVGDDSIVGGDDADYIVGGVGNDSIDAGSGNDVIVAGDDNDYVDAGVGDDSVLAGNGNDVVIGGEGNDTLDGGAGNDSMVGGIGDDVLRGGTGNDTLDGSSGTDTADYSGETGPVTVNLVTGLAQGGLGSSVGTDTLIGIENVVGTSSADVITGDDVANVLRGGGGADLVMGGAGNDRIDFDGNDTIDGGEGSDTVVLTESVDFSSLAVGQLVAIEEVDMKGSGAQVAIIDSDFVFTQSDTDTIRVHGDAGDQLTLVGNWISSGTSPVSYEGAAVQPYTKYTLVSGGSTATMLFEPTITLSLDISGGSGNDNLVGASGNDRLRGLAGNDTLVGGGGCRYIRGRR
jgi:Ca2+-binding RTX toxin-like protein